MSSMNSEEKSFFRFLRQPLLQGILAALSGAGILVSLICIFTVVAGEAVMGPVQRIFYFHVGAALASYLIIGVLLFTSALYLADRDRQWDELADASAWVAFLLTTIVLAS